MKKTTVLTPADAAKQAAPIGMKTIATPKNTADTCTAMVT